MILSRSASSASQRRLSRRSAGTHCSSSPAIATHRQTASPRTLLLRPQRLHDLIESQHPTLAQVRHCIEFLLNLQREGAGIADLIEGPHGAIDDLPRLLSDLL